MLKFRRLEIRDIILSIGALSLAVSGIGPNLPGIGQILPRLIAVSIPLSLAFVVHEIAHKALAANYGYQSFYQMWPQGLFLALLLGIATSGRFIFAAPGAVMIQAAHSSQKENGIISLSGPLTNLVLAGLFFLLFLLPSMPDLLVFMAVVGVRINLLLALFNLLPFPPLDGSKIFRWRPEISLPLLALTGYLLFFAVPF